jgi:hypothetical protein
MRPHLELMGVLVVVLVVEQEEAEVLEHPVKVTLVLHQEEILLQNVVGVVAVLVQLVQLGQTKVMVV